MPGEPKRRARTDKRVRKRPVGAGPLRFGIDVDGTVSQAPRHFRRLIDALLDRGDEVYIITGRRENTRRETEELLARLGIRYTQLLMRPVEWAGTVPEYKVKMVRRKRVHLFIDDDPDVCQAIQRQTEALAAHMLPVPEMPEAREARARLGE